MMEKLDDKVFKKAADQVYVDLTACYSIARVIKNNIYSSSAIVTAYRDYFDGLFKLEEHPRAFYLSFDTNGEHLMEFSTGEPLGQLRREIALDLAAEVLKSEQKEARRKAKLKKRK